MRALLQLQNDCPQALGALDITRVKTFMCVCIYFFAPLLWHKLYSPHASLAWILKIQRDFTPLINPSFSLSNSPGSHTLIYDSGVTRELPLVVCLLSALIYWFWNCCATGYAFYWTMHGSSTHTRLYILYCTFFTALQPIFIYIGLYHSHEAQL